ncbi:hypothetical protein J3Q64DRAFT_1724105 [Phycomyces blakesleeanus]|uniref:Uncharacterized protein n=1 Tax=Phycomyces blakesleeanus TaxID=4837 RepID=A0ABR3B6D4_PHYBL
MVSWSLSQFTFLLDNWLIVGCLFGILYRFGLFTWLRFLSWEWLNKTFPHIWFIKHRKFIFLIRLKSFPTQYRRTKRAQGFFFFKKNKIVVLCLFINDNCCCCFFCFFFFCCRFCFCRRRCFCSCCRCCGGNFFCCPFFSLCALLGGGNGLRRW